MAPSAVAETLPPFASKVDISKATKSTTLDRALFPDGLKTSGQHPVLESAIYPYEEFPKEITGSTVWRAEDYRDSPDRWTHRFSEEEIAELGKAADDYIASERALTGIARVSSAVILSEPLRRRLHTLSGSNVLIPSHAIGTLSPAHTWPILR